MAASASALHTSPAAAAAGDRSITFKVPLLSRILATPDDDEDPQRTVILDLGGPCQTLLEHFGAERPCRIEIGDFAAADGIRHFNGLESIEEDGPRLLQRLLPPPSREPLDLILCWDLPNYLRLAPLKLLFEMLAQRAAPGCKLHMLIAYAKREMSAHPCRYLPQLDGTIRQIPLTADIVDSPRYSPEALGDAVGGFSYERGVLLANGMQEFVYAWPR